MTGRQGQSLRSVSKSKDANPNLPRDPETEESVIAAVLESRDALDMALDLLMQEHFFVGDNATIYTAIGQCAVRGAPVNVPSVAAQLRDTGKLDQIGGEDRLTDIVQQSAIGTIEHVRASVERLVEFARRRAVIAVMLAKVAEGCSPDALSNTQWIESVVDAVGEAATTHARSASQTIGEVMKPVMDAAHASCQGESKVVGMSTGLPDLDDQTGGLHRKEVLFLKGRSGGGKSSWSRQVGVNIARDPTVTGKNPGDHIWEAVFFGVSDSMTNEQITLAITCTFGGVEEHRIRTKRMEESDPETGALLVNYWGKLVSASEWLRTKPIFIHHDSALTISALRAELRLRRAQLAKRGWPCDVCGKGKRCPARLSLIVLDTVQVFGSNEPERFRGEEENKKLDRVGRGILKIAEDFNAPVIGISQLNKDGGIHGAPSLKTHAQAEFLLRTAKKGTKPATEGLRRENHVAASIVIEKQRHGPETTVPLWFNPNLTKFEGL